MKSFISIASPEQAEEIANLVHASFSKFVAPDWASSAQENFFAESSAHKLRADIPNSEFAAVAQLNQQLVGFIVLPTPNLLSMLFVHPGHVGCGIGGALWQAAKQHLQKHHPALEAIELNASPFSVPAYLAMGFQAMSAPFRKGGCVATRMAFSFQEHSESGGTHVA